MCTRTLFSNLVVAALPGGGDVAQARLLDGTFCLVLCRLQPNVYVSRTCVLLLLTAVGSAAGPQVMCRCCMCLAAALCLLYVSRRALMLCKVVVTCIVRHCIISQFVYDWCHA